MKIFIFITIMLFLAVAIYLLKDMLFVLFSIKLNRKTKTLYEIDIRELSSIWIQYNKEFTGKDNDDHSVEVLLKSIETENIETESSNNKLEEGQLTTISEIDTIGTFYNEVIKPYEDKFKEQNVFEVLINILKMLDKHGNVPSVVIDVKDNESVDLISVRENLAQVTLKEHTFTVTRIMIDLIKQNYSEYENFIPQGVIMALSHDVGKIPELRLTGLYNSYDHAIVSSNWLAEQFTGKDVFWAKQAVTAVRDHHLKSKEPLTGMLREADKQARQMELVKFTQNYSIKSFDEWFNIDEFLADFATKINVTVKGKWETFSFKGIIYVKPELLYEIAKKQMFDKKTIDMLMIYDTEKENALRKIISKLREKSFIPDIIGENYISRKFEIKMKMQIKKQQMILTAIKAEPFLDRMEEIERRKSGTQLELIETVIPM